MYYAGLFTSHYTNTLIPMMRDFINRPTPSRDEKARKRMEELREERIRRGLTQRDTPIVFSTMTDFPSPALKPDV